MTSLRDLPSIEQLMQGADHLIQEYGRPLTLEAFRSTLDETRTQFKLALSRVEVTKPERCLTSTDFIFAQA